MAPLKPAPAPWIALKCLLWAVFVGPFVLLEYLIPNPALRAVVILVLVLAVYGAWTLLANLI